MDSRSPALFLADAMALDFLNSVATPIDTQIDWMGDGEGLLRWLRQARLVPEDALAAIAAEATSDEMDEVAAQARDLREWFRSFVRTHKGQKLPSDALNELGPLNRLLERDETFVQVAARKSDADMPLVLERIRRWKSAESLLFPLGGAIGEFVCSEDFTAVKACEGPACTLLFADHTHGRRRRWCSMAICGNRAKQAAHRQRQRLA